MPPVAVTSARVKAIGASLKTKLTVAVGLATFTSRLSIETVTVGVTTIELQTRTTTMRTQIKGKWIVANDGRGHTLGNTDGLACPPPSSGPVLQSRPC